MTVAIDFDGVIHWYRSGWQGGEIYDPPMPGAIEAVREIMEHEATFILTARDVDQVAAALKEWGLPARADLMTGKRKFWNKKGFLLVTNLKYAARAYLDDRAIRFVSGKGEKGGGWEQALQDLDIMPAETYHTYLVTVKLPKNPTHNPRKKITGPCPVNGEPCSDVTGEHHTVIMRSAQGLEWVRDKYARQYHVTRVESVPEAIPF